MKLIAPIRTLLVLTILVAFCEPSLGQTTWYVDDDNCPGGSGSSTDPFCSI